MTSHLSKCITAARAYAGLERDTLADGISMTPTGLQRVEAGVGDLSPEEQRTLVENVAFSTGLPEQFFTVDWDVLQPAATRDLGQRIRAARGYTGITQETLVEDLDLTRAQLERIEVGLDEPDSTLKPRIVEELARATHLPKQFFTGDFGVLEQEASPEGAWPDRVITLEQHVAELQKQVRELTRLVAGASPDGLESPTGGRAA